MLCMNQGLGLLLLHWGISCTGYWKCWAEQWWGSRWAWQVATKIHLDHIITIISYLLGYYSDQWLDEAIIGFLSILSEESKPSVLFNFSQFLANAIHNKFVNFITHEVFQYSSVLVYMFVYFQGDRFQFTMSKLNEEGEPQSVIF